MSETKFTKGPWVVSEHEDEVSVFMGEAVDSPHEYNCSDVWVCDSYWSENDETAIANANLIAAAPEMYQMLKKLVEPYGMEDFSHEEVENLLAKARGE